MIILLLIVPLIGIFAIILVSNINIVTSFKIQTNVSDFNINSSVGSTNTGTNSTNSIKVIALATTLLNFIISIWLWGEFDSNSIGYQFTWPDNNFNALTTSEIINMEDINTDYGPQKKYLQWRSHNFKLGIDGISLYFVVLTTFISPICILSNWDTPKKGSIYFIMSFLLLETLLIAVFTVCDLILFYVFFESVLIPLFLVVGVWGGSSTRVRAAFLLFLYTLFGSLFILLAFMVIYFNIGTTDFTIVSMYNINLDHQKILWIAIFISMAIKTPLMPFNTWLTYAHAEAPVAGSIILAGLVLKLATYGYMRIMLQILPDASYYFSPLVQTISIITIVYASLTTIRQTDFKKLVAYSSVAHAATIVLGLFSNTIQGIEGAILLGVAHGLVSPALFFLVGGVLYDRYHTRTIKYYRGITVYIPLFSLFFFIFTIFNAAVPLSANWAAEFLCLTGIFQTNPIVAIIGSTGIVFSAAYSIWLFNRISFGTWSPYLEYTTDINRREFMLILPLLIGTIIFGFFPNVVLDQIHMSVSTLIYSTSPYLLFFFTEALPNFFHLPRARAPFFLLRQKKSGEKKYCFAGRALSVGAFFFIRIFIDTLVPFGYSK